ncbi:MAG: sigma-70 family RNA polymerase sigma factor [Clostridia bacterium]|nr:sigma-70 family RNA polymerase sigma factor [Clostridia bacterium]
MYEELYEQNHDLLQLLARRWAAHCERDPAVSVEDLAQAGFFGLIEAAETFDEKAGKSWFGWAAWHVYGEFEKALGYREGKPTRAHTGALALDAPVSVDDAEGLTFLDTLPDDSLPDIDAGALLDDLQKRVREAVGRLQDERQRRTVELCDLEGKPLREAAESFGVSVERARQLHRKSLQQLKKDKQLRALVDDPARLDERTRFHAHKGVAAFNRDWTSVTEAAALWRVEQRERCGGAQQRISKEEGDA